ncbi:uncharacterized protein K441DRAFT_550027, partial [Cenococcum geophilum 1.58]|uniref:uncharacterized protein n=1 Tax=Cenococcum geophilum 1.58 TaxID=794803 RepID=UPI00358EE1D5
EAVTNIININEFDSGTVKRMIQFIYKRDYNNSGGDNKDITIWPTTADITLYHVYVNAIADYYNIL